jgi:hypothetical protein
MVTVLSSARLWAGPAVERLGSREQAVRDEAAKELREAAPKLDPDHWKPLMRRLRAGTSWGECLAILGPMTNNLQPLYAQMWHFHQECRLDDFHILRLHLSASADFTPRSDYQLEEAELRKDVRYVWVSPPKGFTGTWTTYFINGRKSHEFGYRDGSYFGTCTTYDPDGNVVGRTDYAGVGRTDEAQGGPPNGSQPIRSETNSASGAAGSRR